MLSDSTTIQIIDTKAKVLDPALMELKKRCFESVVKYVQKLLNNFIIAFAIFVVVLTVSTLLLLLIGFKTLRKSMWDTNIILKIIPFEAIAQKDRVKIKDFFNS